MTHILAWQDEAETCVSGVSVDAHGGFGGWASRLRPESKGRAEVGDGVKGGGPPGKARARERRS